MKFKGKFKKGKRNGNGIYKGYWKNGKKIGQGEFYFPDKNIWKKVKWKEGKKMKLIH